MSKKMTIVVAICALLYLLIGYEYFLTRFSFEGAIALVATVYIYVWVLPDTKEVHTSPLWPGLLQVVAILTFGLAALGDSPLLCVFSGIIMLWSIAIRYRPKISWPDLWPWMMLSLFTLRLPGDIGRKLTFEMRLISSKFSSVALDTLGVIHVQSGNVISLPTKDLFVEEACSGIANMQALFMAFAIYGAWKHVRFLPYVLTALSIGIWAIMGNVLRITAIAVCETWWRWDLTTGLPHTILGVLTFGLACLGVVVLCSFLQYSLHITDGLSRQWYFWQQEGKDSDRMPLTLRSQIIVCSLLFIFTAIHLVKPSAITQNDEVVMINPDLLPKQFGKWQLTEVVPVKIWGEDTPEKMAVRSQAWLYSAPSGNIRIAVDYPFSGNHPLEQCYKGLGYTEVNKEYSEQFVRCHLEKNGQAAMMDYTIVTKSKTVTGGENTTLGFLSSFTKENLDRVGFGDKDVHYQVQVLSAADTISHAERRQILEAVRDTVVKKIK